MYVCECPVAYFLYSWGGKAVENGYARLGSSQVKSSHSVCRRGGLERSRNVNGSPSTKRAMLIKGEESQC